MAEIVNLRREIKRRDRDAAAQKASENRVRHGRTKAERANDAKVRTEAAERLDGLRRDDRPQ